MADWTPPDKYEGTLKLTAAASAPVDAARSL
jgi:hypothetical protein